MNSQSSTKNGTGVTHLPECHYVKDTDNVQYGWNDCICPELRACEQRALVLRLDDLNVKSFNAALDAAEAAVETWISYTFPAHRPGWTGKITAAIRALKEKP